MAVRRRRIIVRTRVRLVRLTSARWRDCAARFKTDFFFFLTLVACPWAIYCSFCVSLKLLTLNEAHAFVKRAERLGVSRFEKTCVRLNLVRRNPLDIHSRENPECLFYLEFFSKTDG